MERRGRGWVGWGAGTQFYGVKNITDIKRQGLEFMSSLMDKKNTFLCTQYFNWGTVYTRLQTAMQGKRKHWFIVNVLTLLT